jgi:hypothetical protein
MGKHAFIHLRYGCRYFHTEAGEGSMVFKLRKVVYSVAFWVAIFAGIVVFNTVWALTH